MELDSDSAERDLFSNHGTSSNAPQRSAKLSRDPEAILSYASTYKRKLNGKKSFLDLPREIRIHIYHLVFDPSRNDLLTFPVWPERWQDSRKGRHTWSTSPCRDLTNPGDVVGTFVCATCPTSTKYWDIHRFFANGGCCAAILRTCWLIYAEALLVLYHQTPVYLHICNSKIGSGWKNNPFGFAQALLPQKIQSMIRSICFNMHYCGKPPYLSLRHLTDLRHVHIIVCRDQIFGAEILQLFCPLSILALLSRPSVIVNYTFTIREHVEQRLTTHPRRLWAFLLLTALHTELYFEQLQLSTDIFTNTTAKNLEGAAEKVQLRAERELECIPSVRKLEDHSISFLEEIFIPALVSAIHSQAHNRLVTLDQQDLAIEIARPRGASILCTTKYAMPKYKI